MKIINLSYLKQQAHKLKVACTLGMFDGVHRGHLFLLNELHNTAKANKIPTLIITFEEHPAQALRGIESDFLLNTYKERFSLLEKTKLVDWVYVIPQVPSLWSLDEKTFLETYVYPYFDIAYFLIGHDSRFGKHRKGNIQFLEKEAKRLNFEVAEQGVLLSEEKQLKINSTAIRNNLKEHQLLAANNMLGYYYRLNGTVFRGSQRGRTIGFPTANILLEDERKLVPQNGVYAVKVYINNEKYKDKNLYGVMNIGVRPTFDVENKRVIEVHILDFMDDIYDAEIAVEFCGFLRIEQKFKDVKELIIQLKEDKKETFQFFKALI